jgi:ribosomal protein S18 acetylase RimI-like enzyme
MIIKEIKETSPQLYEKINFLLKQLTKRDLDFSMQSLATIINSDSSILLGAFNNSNLIGMLTLVVINIPTGKQGRIEDVVVDKTQRNRGVGEALTIEALKTAKNIGVKKVSLTSSPTRIAANKLYQKLGFKLLETNPYIYAID